MKMSTILLSALLAFTFAVIGQDDHHHHHHENPVKAEAGPTTELSPELRALLVEEMKALDKAMSDLSPQIVSGNWSSVEEIAAKMRDSFILKQRLTPEQGKELHGKLPESFIDRDRAFHATANRLAEAARNQNGELTVFYHYRLLEACMGCHAAFAPQKFPGLKKGM